MARETMFRIADVSRALKAAQKGGMHVGSVEIDPATGRIVIRAADAAQQPASELDSWIKKHGARQS